MPFPTIALRLLNVSLHTGGTYKRGEETRITTITLRIYHAPSAEIQMSIIIPTTTFSQDYRIITCLYADISPKLLKAIVLVRATRWSWLLTRFTLKGYVAWHNFFYTISVWTALYTEIGSVD